MQVWTPQDRDHFWKVFMVSIYFYFAYESRKNKPYNELGSLS